MIPILNREYLQELRDTANGMVSGNLNPDWARAYQRLADAADCLDAMQARTQVPPPDGWREGTPPDGESYRPPSVCHDPPLQPES